jgi:hypothetical protein
MTTPTILLTGKTLSITSCSASSNERLANTPSRNELCRALNVAILLLAAANLSGTSLAVAQAQSPAPPVASENAQPDRAPWDIPPLKDAVKDAFLLDVALDYPRRPEGPVPKEVAIATRHFNAFTPENSMKPMALQPREGQFHFAPADRLVELAEEHGATPIGHGLASATNRNRPCSQSTKPYKRPHPCPNLDQRHPRATPQH